ncbi:extracellular superoxide dismutase [Cu-Zn] [Pteropus alecto]|uniref:extracellular superoxide dismutase [Cu-Zn] n=1 Tax=Pteropus alecto TaxID=9402 RepID=UPI0007685081|nr:extracellular superoxide dismutase [Cu-Zn] [Pteropus alecto]
MLSLLCACLLLVACASEGSFDMEDQIRDIHAKVMEIWQEMTGGRAVRGSSADPTLHAACEVRPSASLDASEPQVTGRVLFRQLAPGARLEAFFALEGFPAEPNVSSRAIHVHQFLLGILRPLPEVASGPPRSSPITKVSPAGGPLEGVILVLGGVLSFGIWYQVFLGT